MPAFHVRERLRSASDRIGHGKVHFIRPNLVSDREDNGLLHQRSQFANIAGPTVSKQSIFGGGSQCTPAFARQGDKVASQRKNILTEFAQGWNGQYYVRQTVVEILAALLRRAAFS